MRVVDTNLPGVKLIEPKVYGDARGFFFEAWNERVFRENVADQGFVQDNHSRSARGVLRGLHYQLERPQGKLVRVVAGAIFDVAVDIRKSSPTFGRWVGAELSEENQRMLWIPAGFAHGFLSLCDGTDLLYKCTEYYDPRDERAVRWNDPALNIEWPSLDLSAPQLSARDAAAPGFREAELHG